MRTEARNSASRIPARGLAPCRTLSPIQGRRLVTRSMKHPTERRFEGTMKFFTPELYLRYNSPDDAEADRADEEWEEALRAYRDHLAKYSRDMNDRVKDLAECLCL